MRGVAFLSIMAAVLVIQAHTMDAGYVLPVLYSAAAGGMVVCVRVYYLARWDDANTGD